MALMVHPISRESLGRTPSYSADVMSVDALCQPSVLT